MGLAPRKGALPFVPEAIGSHWSRTIQADVVAINWAAHAILVGECKWGADAVDRQTVRALIERTAPLTVADLPDRGGGLAGGAGAEGSRGMLVDLTMLFEDLAEA